MVKIETTTIDVRLVCKTWRKIMSAYVIGAIWLLSNIMCLYLVKNRNIAPSLISKVVGVLLGPFAIPLVFFLKPKP